jgi:hypothetical protein
MTYLLLSNALMFSSLLAANWASSTGSSDAASSAASMLRSMVNPHKYFSARQSIYVLDYGDAAASGLRQVGADCRDSCCSNSDEGAVHFSYRHLQFHVQFKPL